MKEFTLPNGSKIKVVPAPFKDAIDLKNAVMQAAIQNKALKDVDLKNLDLNAELGEGFFASLMNIVMSIDSNETVFQLIFKCAERCTYDNEKITPQIFENEEARFHYYDIVLAVLKENLAPFFKGLVSAFKQGNLLK